MTTTILVVAQQKETKKLFKNPIPTLDITPFKDVMGEINHYSIESYVTLFDEYRSPAMYCVLEKNGHISLYPFPKNPLPYFQSKIQEVVDKQSLPDIRHGDKVFTLNQRINNLYKTIKEPGGKDEHVAIEKAIDQLPSSVDKVALWRRISNFGVYNKTYFEDITRYAKSIEAVIFLIKNDVQKANAYIDFSNFYSTYYIHGSAIEMLYKARKIVHSSKVSEFTKNNMQGYICSVLADLFAKSYYRPHIQKSHFYTMQAALYYQRTENIDKITKQILGSIANQVFALDEVTSGFTKEDYDTYIKGLLFALKTWLAEYSLSYNGNNKRLLDYQQGYAGTYSIGVLMWKLNRPAIAINYFMETLQYAIQNEDYGQIKSAVSYLSYIYSKIGEPELSKNYANLLLPFRTKKHDRVPISILINQAEYLNNQKLYDSAYKIVLNLENDTTLIHYFYPPVQDEIYELIFKTKSNIAFSIDSLTGYKAQDAYMGYREFRRDQFADMLATENKGISEWLENIGENELSLKEELIRTKDINYKILSGQKVLSDSLASSNARIAQLKGDSLYIAEFNRIKDSIYYSDSLRKSNAIRLLEKRNAEIERDRANAQIELRNYLIGGSVLIFCASILIGGLLYKRNMTRQQNEIDRVNNLAKNNIHNFKNEYMTFGNLITDGSLEKLSEFEESYGEYLAMTHKNWDKETVTLHDEFVALNSYFTAKAVRMPGIKLIKNYDTIDFKKIRFLQSVFDTIIQNSFKHGFKDKLATGTITIEIKKVEKFLCCTVSDTGKPPSNDRAYLKRKDSGLDLLRARIRNTYKNKPPKDCFQVFSLPERKGTEIKIKLVYEEV